MSEKTNAGPEQGHKSDLDSVEEALVGTHGEEPRADVDDDDNSEHDHRARPAVPGNKSP